MIPFLLLLILLAYLAQTFLSRDRLRAVEADLRPEMTVAEPDQIFYLRITLKNNSRRFLPFLKCSLDLPQELAVPDPAHCTPGRNGCTYSRTTWLRPYQQTEYRIPMKISRRGRYVFRPLHLQSGDFLGLREENERLDIFREIVIAPAPAQAQQTEDALHGFLGEVSVRRFMYEDPILTAGFREYTGQEPMRKISWTQTARGRGIMVKNDDYTAEPTAAVILNADTHGMDLTEELEACFSLARSVCRELELRRIPYELYTNSTPAGGWFDLDDHGILKGSGDVHFDRVLELLGRATDTVSFSDRSLIERLARRRQTCACLLITTAYGMPDEESLRLLETLSDGRTLILTPPARTEDEPCS